MNQSDHLQRSPADLAVFALVFFGFVVTAAGLLTTTLPVCITGAFLMALGFVYFLIKAFLFD